MREEYDFNQGIKNPDIEVAGEVIPFLLQIFSIIIPLGDRRDFEKECEALNDNNR